MIFVPITIYVKEKMASQEGYKNLQSLINSLSDSIQKLEDGTLQPEDTNALLDDARELHERIAILQYLSHSSDSHPSTEIVKNKPQEIESNKKQKKDRKPIALNFDAFESKEPIEQVKQTNLLDAINEEEPNDNFFVQNEEEISINEKFSEQAQQETLAEKLEKDSSKDLIESIGLNQKFLFMNDLFNGENNLYKEAITALNSFDSHKEADEYMDSLSARYSWEKENTTVKKFVSLIERRYH